MQESKGGVSFCLGGGRKRTLIRQSRVVAVGFCPDDDHLLNTQTLACAYTANMKNKYAHNCIVLFILASRCEINNVDEHVAYQRMYPTYAGFTQKCNAPLISGGKVFEYRASDFD